MYRNHTVAVVIPAYNEEGFVGDVIDTLPSFVDRAYPVDDRSTDGTWAEIRERVEQSKPTPKAVPDGGTATTVVPIQHETNRGVGGAIKTGYQRAMADDIDLVAVMGGDGQMDPVQLDALLDPLVEGQADYTKGNRLRAPDYWSGMSRFRLFGNAVLTFLTKLSSGYWELLDPQNGYTAITGAALETVDIDAMYEDYGYCNDLLARLNRHGQRVAHVDIPAEYGDEESSIHYPSYIRNVSGLLFNNFCWRMKHAYAVGSFHPLVLSYLAGVGLVGVGSIAFLAVLVGLVVGMAGATAALLAVVVAALGLQILLSAMHADADQNDGNEVHVT